MSHKNIHRKKRRNVKGHKDPRFSKVVETMFKDSLCTMDEMTEKVAAKEWCEKTGRFKATYDTLPDDSTVVQSLGGVMVFKDTRVFRHLDTIALCLREFSPDFFKEEGLSLMNLRYDRKNRVWGNEENICGLAYLAIAAGLAEWTQDRSEWENNSDKLPKIKFIKQGEDNVKETSSTSTSRDEQRNPSDVVVS